MPLHTGIHVYYFALSFAMFRVALKNAIYLLPLIQSIFSEASVFATSEHTRDSEVLEAL